MNYGPKITFPEKRILNTGDMKDKTTTSTTIVPMTTDKNALPCDMLWHIAIPLVCKKSPQTAAIMLRNGIHPIMKNGDIA